MVCLRLNSRVLFRQSGNRRCGGCESAEAVAPCAGLPCPRHGPPVQSLMMIPVFSLSRLRAGLAALLLAVTFAAPAPAQTPSPDPAAKAQDAQPISARISALRANLNQIESTLKRPNLPDQLLSELRPQITELLEQARQLTEEQRPRVDALKLRLQQLVAPKEGAKDTDGPAESPELTRERASREQAVAEAEEILRLSRELHVQGEQLSNSISDRRRSLFASQLFQRSASALNPALWTSVFTALPGEMRALQTIASDWISSVSAGATAARAGIVLAGLATALFFMGPLGLYFRRFLSRPDVTTPPPRSERAIRNGAIAALGVIRPVGAAMIISFTLETAGLLTGRMGPILVALIGGLAFVFAAHAVAIAIFAPEKPFWRLINVSDEVAERLVRIFVAAAAVQVTGKVLEAAFQSIGSPLALTVGVRAVFSLIFALLLWRGLVALQTRESEPDGVADVPAAPNRFVIWRLLLFVALSVILFGALSGYIALSAFVADQIIWLFIVGTAYFILDYLLTELVESIGRPGNRITERLRHLVGFQPKAIRQISVLTAGIVRALLFIVAVMLAIAPWGVESTDVLSSVRAVLFGFKVGDVTISLSALLIAVAVLGAGIFITRTLQEWLDDKFLPNTDLDPGIKNSLKTAVGYFGILSAMATAISSLGLSLEKLAFVAGALSLGIGFGLQSIVANFVSGLILLWERPIRVGDLIQVGSDSGTVRRINVRSTEILTADRTTIIVPNQTLISGTVVNRVHSDRVARIVIPINVPRSGDPQQITDLLTTTAKQHELVMKEPKPRVLFKKISDSAMEFELIAFVSDVDVAQNVSSELHYAIFIAMREAQVPVPGGKTVVEGIDRVEEKLSQLTQIMGPDTKAAPQKAANASKKSEPPAVI